MGCNGAVDLKFEHAGQSLVRTREVVATKNLGTSKNRHDKTKFRNDQTLLLSQRIFWLNFVKQLQTVINSNVLVPP